MSLWIKYVQENGISHYPRAMSSLNHTVAVESGQFTLVSITIYIIGSKTKLQTIKIKSNVEEFTQKLK